MNDFEDLPGEHIAPTIKKDGNAVYIDGERMSAMSRVITGMEAAIATGSPEAIRQVMTGMLDLERGKQ